jgi:hypothetical protein
MDLINREVLRDEVLNDNTFDNDTVNYYLGIIDSAPAIEPPVVLCKNCKHATEEETDHPCHPVRKYLYCREIMMDEVKPDDFCSYGAKMDAKENEQ